MSDLFPLIKLSGTPAEVGHQHGTLLKDKILRVVESMNGAQIPADKRPFAARMQVYLGTHFPELIEEWKALADAAEITFEQAFALSTAQSFGELPGPHMCSAIAWNNPSLGPFLFKTDDGPGAPPGESVETIVNRRMGSKVAYDLKTTKSHRCLGVSDAGRLWLEVGLNEHGLCMGHSSGRPVLGEQEGDGIPQHVFPGLVLRYCKDCDEAIEFAKQHPVAGKGVNIACADPSGEVIAVEKCGKNTGIRRGREWAFTTNHYQDAKMAELTSAEVPQFLNSQYYANSRARESFLKDHLPKVRNVDGDDPAKQLEVLLEDGPGRIRQCFEKEKGLWTNYAVFLNPRAKSLNVYLGPHERRPHVTYALA